MGFLATVTVDFLIDGLLRGVSLSHDSDLGLLLVIMLTLEEFSGLPVFLLLQGVVG